MRIFRKALLWIIVLVAVGYGAWYAYSKWWGIDNAKRVGGFMDTTAKNIGNAAVTKAGEIGTEVASNTVKSARSFVGSTIGNLLSGLGSSIENAGIGLGGTPSSPAGSTTNGNQTYAQPALPSGSAPAPTSSAFSVPPPPATVMTKVGVPLSFSINSGTTYRVEWGDGKVAEGTTAAHEVTVISHMWSAQGDYTVHMTIGDNGSKTISSFPVRAYQ